MNRPGVAPALLVGTSIAFGLVGAIYASELLHRSASTWHLPEPPVPQAGPVYLLVLGYPSTARGELSAVQRWRTETAVRAFAELGADLAVFSGGSRSGSHSVPEAELMASYARSLGIPGEKVRTETNATSTWENVAFSLSEVAGAGRLAVVSDSLHAARARRYLRAQSPDLAAHLVSAGEHRTWEHVLLKLVCTAVEVPRLCREALIGRRDANGRRDAIGDGGALASPGARSR